MAVVLISFQVPSLSDGDQFIFLCFLMEEHFRDAIVLSFIQPSISPACAGFFFWERKIMAFTLTLIIAARMEQPLRTIVFVATHDLGL